MSVASTTSGRVTTYSAVVTTGIYCRPGCGARPNAENVRTFSLAAAAEAAGFRACLRCRPYRVADPIAASAPELVCRAVRLIIDGTLDDGGTETDLARRLNLSARHLRRIFNEYLGVTPDQLARSRRAHFARRMLDDTELNVADVAFASGFGSLRQFNREMRDVFRAAPRELRDRRRRADRLAADGGLTMRLPFQAPYDWDGMVAYLAERVIPGVESVIDGVYRRTISLDGGPGVLEVHPGGTDHLVLRAHLPYWEGLIHVVQRVTRLTGVDADVEPAVAQLVRDPVVGRLVAARPGLRVPGAWGPFEVAVQSVLEPDLLRLLVEKFGEPFPGLDHGLTHLFPSAEVLTDTDEWPTVGALARAVTSGDVVLDSSADLAELVAELTAVPGIGAGAAHQIALRLGYPDACPIDTLDSAGWRPWRALASVHLAG